MVIVWKKNRIVILIALQNESILKELQACLWYTNHCGKMIVHILDCAFVKEIYYYNIVLCLTSIK